MPLDAADRAILDFEGSWWQRPGPKAAMIRSTFALSPSAYYRRLHRLAASADALAAYPLVVRRVRLRLRAQRRARVTGGAPLPDRRRS